MKLASEASELMAEFGAELAIPTLDHHTLTLHALLLESTARTEVSNSRRFFVEDVKLFDDAMQGMYDLHDYQGKTP